MRRLLTLAVLAATGIAQAGAQTARVVDLGGGIYQAVGVGIAGGAAVRIPQSNTFLVVTSGGNIVIDTSLAAAAPAHKRGADGGQCRADQSDRPDPRARQITPVESRTGKSRTRR